MSVVSPCEASEAEMSDAEVPPTVSSTHSAALRPPPLKLACNPKQGHPDRWLQAKRRGIQEHGPFPETVLGRPSTHR